MDEPRRRSRLRVWWSELPADQRFAISLLILCGGLAFFLSFLQLRSQVRQPFLVSKSVLEKSQKFFADEAAKADRVELLKKQDTDHDGLSDYAEEFVYHTSAYVSDTDSDGIPDAVEIAQHENPNCPKGQACGAASDAVGTVSTSTEGLVFASSTPQLPTQTGELLPPGQMTAAQVRTYMLQNNLATQDQLGQLSDQQILDAYAQAYQSARAQSSASTP